MTSKPGGAHDPIDVQTAEWVALLQYLRDARGFDFHGYKPASLARRIQKRMGEDGMPDFAAYRDFLRNHPQGHAVNTIVAGVAEQQRHVKIQHHGRAARRRP